MLSQAIRAHNKNVLVNSSVSSERPPATRARRIPCADHTLHQSSYPPLLCLSCVLRRSSSLPGPAPDLSTDFSIRSTLEPLPTPWPSTILLSLSR